MVDAGDNFDNPSGHADQFRVKREAPREIDIPAEHELSIPHSILDAVSDKRKESKFGVYAFDVGLASIADPAMPEEEKLALEALPYNVTASDKYLFVSSSVIKDPEHPHANLQIFRLAYNPETGMVTKVIRDADPSIFKVALSEFPDNTLVGQIRQLLTLAPPTDDEKKQADKIAAHSEQMQATQTELERLSNPDFLTRNLIEDEVNTSQIKFVGQAAYSVASADQAEWLATQGQGGCLRISIYDRLAKRGALTHIDAITDAPATVGVMRRDIETAGINDVGEKSYIATISGGSNGMLPDITKAYEELKKWKEQVGSNLDIVVGNMLTNTSNAMALNLKTGELAHFHPMHRPSTSDGSLERMQLQAKAMEASISGKKPAKRV